MSRLSSISSIVAGVALLAGCTDQAPAPTGLGLSASRNGLPFTLSLSCGTWGGNITTENVNARHFVNLTRVSRPIEPKTISEEALFAAHWNAHGR